MKMTPKLTSLALMAAVATTSLAPMALAASTQKDKNNMRNLGIAGAAVAGYGLLKHNTAATVLGAAAGGYGAYKYEQDRKSQSAANRSRARYYRHYTPSGRKYYTYDGHQYYMNTATGVRHLVR